MTSVKMSVLVFSRHPERLEPSIFAGSKLLENRCFCWWCHGGINVSLNGLGRSSEAYSHNGIHCTVLHPRIDVGMTRINTPSMQCHSGESRRYRFAR